MDITASLLNEMFSGFNTVFNKAVQATTTFWNKIAMDVKSTSSNETYGWLSGMPQMREWRGERHIKGVATARYTLENRKFESTGPRCGARISRMTGVASVRPGSAGWPMPPPRIRARGCSGC